MLTRTKPLDVRDVSTDMGLREMKDTKRGDNTTFETRYINVKDAAKLKEVIGNECYVDLISKLNRHPLLRDLYAKGSKRVASGNGGVGHALRAAQALL